MSFWPLPGDVAIFCSKRFFVHVYDSNIFIESRVLIRPLPLHIVHEHFTDTGPAVQVSIRHKSWKVVGYVG